MTDYQNELVMEHLDLVNWVIRTRISVPNRPLLTYDDFYAIGCEAICRAALKYQADSGEFAPFACRYRHVCDITLSKMSAGVLPYGAVSSSGFGDGGYTCYTHADENGVIDFAFIVFI